MRVRVYRSLCHVHFVLFAPQAFSTISSRPTFPLHWSAHIPGLRRASWTPTSMDAYTRHSGPLSGWRPPPPKDHVGDLLATTRGTAASVGSFAPRVILMTTPSTKRAAAPHRNEKIDGRATSLPRAYRGTQKKSRRHKKKWMTMKRRKEKQAPSPAPRREPSPPPPPPMSSSPVGEPHCRAPHGGWRRGSWASL